jgi:AcrR family transcriptional regulator
MTEYKGSSAFIGRVSGPRTSDSPVQPPAAGPVSKPVSDSPVRSVEVHRSKTPIETSARALQILAAADELLSERGPDQVSMRDVAERAGVNKALIFYYFGSRTELFEKVLERYYRNHAKVLANAFSEAGTPMERVKRAVDAYLDFMDSNHLFARLIMQEAAHEEAARLPKVRANLVSLYEVMHEELKGILPADGPLSSRHFFVTMAGTVIHYYTYAKILGPQWPHEPTSPASLRERRAHVQWLVETVMQRLLSEGAPR